MGIQNEIERITANISSAYNAVEEMGGVIPAEQNSANLAAAIQSIPATGDCCHTNPSLLDNWYFLDAINQRIVSGIISTPGYFIDRWILVSGTVELTSDGLRLNGEIQQRLENSIGMDTTATALSTTGLVKAEYNDAEKVFSITGAGETIIAAKLELGDQQTLAHQDTDGKWVLNDPPPNFQQELAKCQRYQLSLRNPESGYIAAGFGEGRATDRAYIHMPLPTTMRGKPTVSYSGEFGLEADGAWNNRITPTSIVVSEISNNLATLTVNGSGITVGRYYAFEGNAGASLLLDANL